MKRTSIFSECKRYRYQLSRTWDEKKPILLFIGLNPSIADASNNDPTIRRLLHFSKNWGYGSFIIVNLFALVTSDPKVLFEANDPIGELNDTYLSQLANRHKTVLIWGNHGSYKGRDQEVLSTISNPYCLKITKTGAPSHPLYLKNDTILIPFDVSENRS